MTTQIIKFPINGDLALAEKPISAAGQARRRPARNRMPPTYRKAKKRQGFATALSIGIVAFLLAAFMPWSAAADKPSIAGTDEEETPAVIIEQPSGTASAEYIPDAAEVEALAKLIFGEAGVVPSTTEQAAVVWCVLNRVDDPRFPDTVLEVITTPSQFTGYSADNPVYEEYEALAADVLKRYHAEQDGDADAGRVLPADYCFFTGDGRRNYFTNEWKSGDTWGWTLSSPYDD